MDKDIEIAISKAKEKFGTPIVREFMGFIILAQSEDDFFNKRNKADKRGFLTVNQCKKL